MSAATVLLDLDPKALAQYPGNVRKNLGDLKGLTANVKTYGVLQPLLVTPVEGNGHYKVIAGKRRLAAAIAAGRDTVPCVVRDDLADDNGERITSLVENLQRKDLTTTEEAEGWRQLQLAGLDDTAIAAVTGVDKQRVATGLAVAKSKVATAVTAKHDLTLEQAAVLAEFDDDKDIVKDLTVLAVKDPGRFPHAASQHRQRREGRRLFDAKVAEVTATGVKIHTGDVGWNMSGPRAISELVDDAGKALTDAKHAACPGHAVKVYDPDWQGIVHTKTVCVAPAKHGHKDRYGDSGGSRSKPEPGSAAAEKATAERRATIAGNKEWRAATPVRLAFVSDLLRRKTAPKEILPFVADELLGYPTQLHCMGATDDVLLELTGVATPKSTGEYSKSDAGLAVAAKATSATLPLAMLAQVAAVRELELRDPMSWRRKDPSHVRYLKLLVAVGYAASDIEARVIKGKK